MTAKHLLQILIPALAIGVGAGAGAAESAHKAKADQKANHAVAQKRQMRKISEQTAEETPRKSQRGDGLNNDAGVPPSGVPSETLNA